MMNLKATNFSKKKTKQKPIFPLNPPQKQGDEIAELLNPILKLFLSNPFPPNPSV